MYYATVCGREVFHLEIPTFRGIHKYHVGVRHMQDLLVVYSWHICEYYNKLEEANREFPCPK